MKKNNNLPLTREIFVACKAYGTHRNVAIHRLVQLFTGTVSQCRWGAILTISQVFIILVSSGCALAPGFNMESGDVITLDDPATQQTLQFKIKPITPALIATNQKIRARTSDDPERRHRYAYRIGAADMLEIVVWDNPELTVVTKFGTPKPRGFIVNDDGTIFFPYAGIVKVAGKTVGEVREEITRRLDEYIERPQVSVSVAEYRSQPVYMFGELMSRSTHFIDRGRVTLAEVIATAGGVNPSTSNPERIYVIRKNMAEPTIFWLQSESPVTMTLAIDFSMQAHDVVFVQAAEVTRWNRVINQLIPSTIVGSLGAAAAFGL